MTGEAEHDQIHSRPELCPAGRAADDDTGRRTGGRSAGAAGKLGASNSHVEKIRVQIARNDKLSPLLPHRDKANGKLIIADGYHRLCAVYKFDEDAMIPCKIV
jgi:hypothetical protein